VGSTRFGKISHEVTVGDEENKSIVIGYICIEYTYPPFSWRTINIDMKNSFFVIPDLIKKPLNEDEKKEKYYEYLDNPEMPKIPIITFNNKFCDVYLFEQIKLDKDMFKSIDLNQRFIETNLYMNDIQPPKF
jgi:hypothetical protein